MEVEVGIDENSDLMKQKLDANAISFPKLILTLEVSVVQFENPCARHEYIMNALHAFMCMHVLCMHACEYNNGDSGNLYCPVTRLYC